MNWLCAAAALLAYLIGLGFGRWLTLRAIHRAIEQWEPVYYKRGEHGTETQKEAKGPLPSRQQK